MKKIPWSFLLPSLSISQQIITSHNPHTSSPTFDQNDPTLLKTHNR